MSPRLCPPCLGLDMGSLGWWGSLGHGHEDEANILGDAGEHSGRNLDVHISSWSLPWLSAQPWTKSEKIVQFSLFQHLSLYLSPYKDICLPSTAITTPAPKGLWSILCPPHPPFTKMWSKFLLVFLCKIERGWITKKLWATKSSQKNPKNKAWTNQVYHSNASFHHDHDQSSLIGG